MIIKANSYNADTDDNVGGYSVSNHRVEICYLHYAASVVFMVMRCAKKQDQPQAMSVFFGSKDQPSLYNKIISNNDSPFSGIYTVWKGLSWLFFHRKYANVGLILAEYATKTAFSYLPNHYAKSYTNILKSLGIDVESVGLSSVGGSALDLVFPGIGGSLGELLIPHTHATKAVEQLAILHDAEGILSNTLKTLVSSVHVTSISDIMSDLIARVKSLAIGNHPLIKDKHHILFAKYLIDSGWAAGKNVNSIAMAQNAFQIYGSHWFDVGLSTLNKSRSTYKGRVPDKILIQKWLQDAYVSWSAWGAKVSPILDSLGEDAVTDMKKEEAKNIQPVVSVASTKAAAKTNSVFLLNHSLRYQG